MSAFPKSMGVRVHQICIQWLFRFGSATAASNAGHLSTRPNWMPAAMLNVAQADAVQDELVQGH
jgi:hypothetical protein